MTDKENEPDEIISIDAVRDFLLKHDGKARQTELVNHFRNQLNSPSTKGMHLYVHSERETSTFE